MVEPRIEQQVEVLPNLKYRLDIASLPGSATGGVDEFTSDSRPVHALGVSRARGRRLAVVTLELAFESARLFHRRA
jgi:hypothetical protein